VIGAYYEAYGGPEVLTVGELAEPKLAPDAVLVEVKASSVNPVDWKAMRGGLDGRFDTLFPVVPGWDLAGVVRSVGASVTEFAPGDEVWGYVRMDYLHFGTYSELTAVPVRTLAPKPSSLSWIDAGVTPLAGLTAYQALVTRIGARPDDRLLVIGGSGGVGTFAVQIARAIGATVMATGSSSSRAYLEELGALPCAYDQSFGDTVKDFAPTCVLDLYGGELLEQVFELGADACRIVSVTTPAITGRGGQYLFVRPSPSDLMDLGELMTSGKVQTRIVRSFDLSSARAAMELSMTGHVKGKVAISIGSIQ
jgi:NADPH:quinone reductase-like Zn-dependent oxidoreductase